MLRRGLLRADGFALFIAVCNSPTAAKELIRFLEESMPGVTIETVTLEEQVTEPLDAILEKINPESRGPVMILGLEASNPSSIDHHPVLQALNLSRAEWPRRLQRPVVFWIPEYLLGLLGREAPDFLDWRSDTLLFSDLTESDTMAFDSAPWTTYAGDSGSEQYRRARIAEIRSRLALTGNDPSALSVRAGWLRELGYHLFFLGKIAAAEQAQREALSIEESLKRPQGIATQLMNLSGVLRAQGRLGEAEPLLRKAVEIFEALGAQRDAATSYSNLGLVLIGLGKLEEAEESIEKALRFYRQADDRLGLARAMNNLAMLYQIQGRSAEVEVLARDSLKIYQMLGYQSGMAVSYSNLGISMMEKGDLDGAEAAFREALKIDQVLGRREGIAKRLEGLGAVYFRRGDLDSARWMFEQALDINQDIGQLDSLAEVSENLGTLYKLKEDNPKAAQFWEKARDLYRRMNLDSKAKELETRIKTVQS